MTSDPQEDYLPVVCPLCHTRMYARLNQVGSQLACPDCGTICPVLPPAPPRPEIKRPDPGEYILLDAGAFGDPTATRTNPLPVKRPDAPDASTAQAGQSPVDRGSPSSGRPRKTSQSDLILVACPLCHTRMHPSASERGKVIKCPDCGTKMTVPTHIEKPRIASAPDLVLGSYDMGAEAPAARPNVDMLVRSQSLPAPAPPSDPPRWSMVSGVFTFPWQREASIRYLYMTAGLLIASAVASFALSTLESSFGGVVGAAALGVVVFFALLWSVLLASACVLLVIRETAAGVSVVDEWPEVDVREWIWPFLYLLEVLGITSAISYGVYWLLHLAGVNETIASSAGGLIVILMFPVVLLSVIENGSALAFYSLAVLRSLWRLPHYWLLFHLETQALVFAWLFVVNTVAGSQVVPAMFISAVYFPAVVLIYARLLGRMAWHVGDLDDKIKASQNGEE